MLGLGQMGSEGLLSVEAVCELTGFSRATLYRRLRAGLFPPRVGQHRFADTAGAARMWTNGSLYVISCK